MMKKLFQYVVLLHTYTTATDGKQEYKDTEIVLPMTTMLAKNDREVAFKLTRLIPVEKADNPENIEIIIRPF